MKRETVNEMWDSFARAVLPPNCSTVQRWEMRRAFYAGCHAMLEACSFGIGDDSVSEEQGVQWIEEWHQELRRFQADVREGRA